MSSRTSSAQAYPAVIVAGSRDLSDELALAEVEQRAVVARAFHAAGIDRRAIDELISGGNDSSPDKWGETWASFRSDVDVVQFTPDWNDIDHPDAVVREGQYGKYDARAGPRRNGKMAEYADALVAFWDGESPGTKDMIDQARDAGLRVQVFRLDNEIARRVILQEFDS
jgi:glycerophosphoryl diester phosphodiesterase